ncbi:MAG: LamG-like jellyroll fold domain-containing protein, partial [Ilumatobacteraceae bacterium]
MGSSGLADFSTGITVQATVNFGDANEWERIIDLGNGDASNNILFAREGTTGHLVFEIYRGTTSQGLCRFENGIVANEFANYAVTLDASGNCQIYRNGSAQTTTWTAGAAKGLPNNVTRSSNYIGKSNWAADDDFGGVIRSVALYSRVLTSAEIAVNYDAEREFTITYNSNDATSGSAPASGTYTTTSFTSAGTAATVAANSGSLARTGRGFSGWNTAIDESGTSYAAGGSYQTAADVTLYAIFNDTTAPTFQSGSVNAAGTQLTLTYSEALSATTAATSAFVVKNVNIPNTVTAVAVSGSTVVLTLRETIYSGQTVTVAYTDPTAGNDANAIQDSTGNDAATLSATSVTNNATAAVPAAARLIGLNTETLVNLTGPEGGIRGITSDGTKVFFRTSNDYTKMWEIPISSITSNPNGTTAATATSWTITDSPSLRETTAMAYSSGCIFVLDASDVLKCIDVTTRTASTVTVPAGKPLPTGQVWLTGSLIDFPDGRFGKVSAPTGSGSSYSSTLRLYTVSGTGSAVTLAWSEDITLLDIESFPSDDHGIATDGTYLYRIQYASGYKVWRLRSGVDSSIIFNGNGSGSCAGSGTLCSINEPGTTNATYIAHDHAGNRYFVGDYSHPQFYMTEAQSPGSGPGSDSTPPSQPGAPDLVDGSDAGSSNTDNVTSVGSPNISVVAAENGGTLTVTATKTGSSDVTCTMVGTTS